MADLPWFKFYPSDWLGSGTLRRASHATKGFYIDLLCVMFDCESRGKLEASGVPWTEQEIARSVNGDPTENLTHLRWLVQSGVLSKDDRGVIFSRRMVKDESRRRSGSEAGKRGGGNPNLSKDSPDSQTYKGKPKGQFEETLAPSEEPIPDTPSISSESPSEVSISIPSSQTFIGTPKGESEKPLNSEARGQIPDTRSQKLNPPPPPTPSEPSAPAAPPSKEEAEEGRKSSGERIPTTSWQALEARLRNLDMVATGEVVDRCLTQGITPEFANEIINYWTSKPPDFWGNMLGALHHKLTNVCEGEQVDSAWPEPAAKYTQAKKLASAEQVRQLRISEAEEAEARRERERLRAPVTPPASQPTTPPLKDLEASFGQALDDLPREEREVIAEELYGARDGFRFRMFTRNWHKPGMVRKELLQEIERRSAAGLMTPVNGGNA